jgi:excisionase family DNA binding protein
VRVTMIREAADPERVPDFLTVGEAAAVLRIGRTAAYDLAREYLATGGEGGLPAVRVGKQLRVPRYRIEAMLGGPINWPPFDNQRVEPTAVVTEPARARSRSTGRDRSNDQQLFSV